MNKVTKISILCILLLIIAVMTVACDSQSASSESTTIGTTTADSAAAESEAEAVTKAEPQATYAEGIQTEEITAEDDISSAPTDDTTVIINETIPEETTVSPEPPAVKTVSSEEWVEAFENLLLYKNFKITHNAVQTSNTEAMEITECKFISDGKIYYTAEGKSNGVTFATITCFEESNDPEEYFGCNEMGGHMLSCISGLENLENYGYNMFSYSDADGKYTANIPEFMFGEAADIEMYFENGMLCKLVYSQILGEDSYKVSITIEDVNSTEIVIPTEPAEQTFNSAKGKLADAEPRISIDYRKRTGDDVLDQLMDLVGGLDNVIEDVLDYDFMADYLNNLINNISFDGLSYFRRDEDEANNYELDFELCCEPTVIVDLTESFDGIPIILSYDRISVEIENGIITSITFSEEDIEVDYRFLYDS